MGSSRTLNFSNKQIISKQEYIEWDSSLREYIGNLVRVKGNGKGILANAVSGTVISPESFTVTDLSSMTIQIGNGYGILDVSGVTSSFITPNPTVNNQSVQESQSSIMFYYPGGVSVDLTTLGLTFAPTDELYIGFIPTLNQCEQGEWSISASTNQVTTTNGTTKLLRDQSYDNPTKVRFYKNGEPSLSNPGIYEVVSKIGGEDGVEFIISGSSLSTDSGLSMLIVGSYDLSIQGNLDDSSCYVKYDGVLSYELNPSSVEPFGVNGGFTIAKIVFGTPTTTYSIIPLHSANVLNFAIPWNVSYIDADEDFSGRKNFKSTPRFNSFVEEVFNPESTATPIAIGSSGLVTIDDSITYGSVYTVSTVSYITLNAVYLTGGAGQGKKIFLRFTGTDDAIINLGTSGGQLKTNTKSTGQITIKTGSILELICDESLSWTILNYGSDSDTGWIRVLSIIDSTPGTPLSVDTSGDTNQFFYREKGGVLFIKITNFYPSLSFTLPLTLTLPAQFANNDLVGLTRFEIGSTRTVTIDSFGVASLNFQVLDHTEYITYIR